jgi:hypothetical protein
MLWWMGGVTLFVVAAVAYLFARTFGRTVLLLVIGAAAVLAGYVYFRTAGWFEPADPGCYEHCGFDAIFAGLLLIGNGIAWGLGVAAGATLWRLRNRDEDGEPRGVRFVIR